MRAVIVLLRILLVACGGSKSGNQTPPPVSLPGVPVVTVETGVKHKVDY